MTGQLNKSVSRTQVANVNIQLPIESYSANKLASQSTKSSLARTKLWGILLLFTQVLILRGVGYKFFKVVNDQTNKQSAERIAPLSTSGATDSSEGVTFWHESTKNEFPYSEFLIARVGHTKDLCWPIPKNLYIKASKKDKKLILSSPSKLQVTQFVSNLIKYRPISVYTGRGIRVKHTKPIRKAGKRDQRKGKAF